MSSRPPSSVMPVTQPQGGVKKTDRLLRWIVVALLVISVIVTTAYTALSIYIATQLVYAPQKPIYATPASLGLQFKYVTFASREDQVQLKGWFIPGVLPDGTLTAKRTIITVHVPIVPISMLDYLNSAVNLLVTGLLSWHSICVEQVNHQRHHSLLVISSRE